jgi:hypothetical protein
MTAQVVDVHVALGWRCVVAVEHGSGREAAGAHVLMENNRRR